jgi:hypothetical protein
VVSRESISRIERGGAGQVPLTSLRRVAEALGVRMDVVLGWQGGEIDRVINSGHALMHEAAADLMAAHPGWITAPEVSFSIYGERGVIDILAWHAASRSLLIIELKTALVDPQDLVATMDRRVRLGNQICRERGWIPATVSAWVLVADTRTNHRRLIDHGRLLRGAFPADGHAIRSWLQRPSGRIGALSFLPNVVVAPTNRVPSQPRRVRVPSATSP